MQNMREKEQVWDHLARCLEDEVTAGEVRVSFIHIEDARAEDWIEPN